MRLNTDIEVVDQIIHDLSKKWHPNKAELYQTIQQAVEVLGALAAERDMCRDENLKKQKTCEQMGRRITELESSIKGE